MIERKIPDWSYTVTDDGRVFSLLHGQVLRKRELRPTRGGTGGAYLRFHLSDGKRLKRFYAHHLVAEVFIGPRPSGLQIRHLDGDPSNNRVCNLSWGTGKENMEDSRRHGTLAKGTRNWNAKLNEKDVLAIRSALARGVMARQLARKYGLCEATISQIKSRTRWGWL